MELRPAEHLRRPLAALHLTEPPPSGERQVEMLRVFTLLGAGAELTGPAADLLWHLIDPAHPAFYPTSAVNLAFSALFLSAWAVLRLRGPAWSARWIIYGGLLLGLPSLHVLGGALGPAVTFLCIPLVLGTFFLPLAEWATGGLVAAAAWLALVALEAGPWPPPMPAQDPRVFAVAYIVTGVGGLAALLALVFGTYRRISADLMATTGRLEEALTVSRRQADDLAVALRAKDAFLATVSHELRTPVAGIVGLAELAQRPGGMLGSDEARRIHAGAVHLLRVVENMLDLTRWETGDLKVKTETLDPAALIEQTVAFFRSLCADTVELRVDLESLPARCRIDGDKLRRILANLLANAIRATVTGSITIRGRLTGADLIVDVIDTGVGFDPRRPDPGEAGGSRVGEGMGLGLRIVDTLVSTLDGAFVISSRPGEGTHATVRIPCERRDEPGGVEEARSATPRRVLVVEDHADLRDVFRSYCAAAGWHGATASGAAEAIDVLRRERFDLVLMDIFMPGMDGHQALRAIRAEFGALAPPILALTAHVAGDDEAALVAAGFDGFIPKPVALTAFIERIEQALEELPDGRP